MNDPLDSAPKQLGFDIGGTQPAPSLVPDPEEIRAELTEILEAARSATDEMPWDARTFRYHKVVLPQMARWLPEDQRDQLCLAFAREVERLELLMGA
jgi:hypothetical protein